MTLSLTGAAGGRWRTHFSDGATTLDLGAGISVDSVSVLGPDRVDAVISIDTAAETGQRQLRVVTGDEVAVSVPAFSVLPGAATLSGVLLNSETGQPIAGARIAIEGTNLRATSGVDGSFSVAGVSAGGHQLLINAPDHALLRIPVDAVAGMDQSLGELTATPTVLAADAPASASVLSLIARGIGDATRRMSFAEAEDITRDALMLVGGREIGILDADGNQQNPEVGNEVPFWSFNEDTVSTIAERMLTTERRTLGEVRVAGHQKAMMWLDNAGMHHYPFGFSGRILLPDGSPLVAARVSIPERLQEVEVRTDEHGIFKLRGLCGPDLPDELALLVRTRDGQVCQFQLLLNAVGHTVAERMDFVAVTPPPPLDDQPLPSALPVVPVQTVEPGDTTIIETPVETPETQSPASGTAPVVAILGLVDGLETDRDQVTLRGFVIGGTVLSAVLERNDAESPLAVTDGVFETRVALGDGLTRLRVVVESLDGQGHPVVGRSDAATVFKTDTPSTGALSGRVMDETTGLPVPGASIHARDYGISALTDHNGVWQLTRVPPGDVSLEVVP